MQRISVRFFIVPLGAVCTLIALGFRMRPHARIATATHPRSVNRWPTARSSVPPMSAFCPARVSSLVNLKVLVRS